MICHCQGTYGAERLWEGSLKYNKTENCSGINRAFGKRESFRRVLLKYRYTTFNQSPMKWPSFPWKSSYRWQYPFPYCVVENQDTRGQSECSSLIGWFFDMVYFQQWSRTESKTSHVTLLGRSYWISYIHTRSKKTKETKKLTYSIGNFLCNKIPCFCHHVESYHPSIFIISTKQNRSQFSWTVPSYSFVSDELWLWWHREGFH